MGGLAARGDARPVEDRPDDAVGQIETSVTPQAVDIEEGTVFAAYRVQKAVVRGAHPHPANVVESTAMACVEPPDVTYRHHLPAEVIVEGRISNLQLEDVIYAGQATGALLPDGSRKRLRLELGSDGSIENNSHSGYRLWLAPEAIRLDDTLFELPAHAIHPELLACLQEAQQRFRHGAPRRAVAPGDETRHTPVMGAIEYYR